MKCVGVMTDKELKFEDVKTPDRSSYILLVKFVDMDLKEVGRFIIMNNR